MHMNKNNSLILNTILSGSVFAQFKGIEARKCDNLQDPALISGHFGGWGGG